MVLLPGAGEEVIPGWQAESLPGHCNGGTRSQRTSSVALCTFDNVVAISGKTCILMTSKKPVALRKVVA